MRFLAALSAGVSVFLFVATMTGHADNLGLRLPGTKKDRLSRQVWLRQAGVNVTPFQFRAVSAGSGFVMLLVCWSIGGSVTVGLVPAMAAWFAPRAYFGRRRSVHLRLVVEAWPQAIRDLLSTIESRRSVHNAIIELSASGPDPMRVAFHDYPALARLGGTVKALTTVREQLADPISDRVIELLIVAHDQGQALTLQVLRDQARQIGDDLRTSAEIHAAQAEPRLVASAAFVLPWLGLVMICASVPAYREFYRTPGGLVAVAIAGSMSSAGMVIARRLAKEAAEPRVMGDVA